MLRPFFIMLKAWTRNKVIRCSPPLRAAPADGGMSSLPNLFLPDGVSPPSPRPLLYTALV